jgi:hypothetical protein
VAPAKPMKNKNNTGAVLIIKEGLIVTFSIKK